MPEDWVRLYVVEIAMALQHLHDMDVVYRDLKPENILLCGDGHLKVEGERVTGAAAACRDSFFTLSLPLASLASLASLVCRTR